MPANAEGLFEESNSFYVIEEFWFAAVAVESFGPIKSPDEEPKL
jgi:hypothetical protein